MKTLNNCPVCEGTEFSPFITVEDHTVSHEQFTIVACKTCGFKLTNPRPADLDLGKYYKSEDYISHSDTRKGLISKLYHVVRNYTLSKKLRLVEGIVSRGTLLDFGAGTGLFLKAAKDRGWQVCGIEPDEGASSIASKRIGGQIYSSWKVLSERDAEARFSAITLWHVLEHVPDLNETIEFLKTRLDNNGALFIAVPNHQSCDARYYKSHWAAYDVPRHLYHFDVGTIKSLMETHDFRLVKMEPMKFDSFYVSMLSEKYRTGKVNLIRAFVQGLASNWKAKGPGGYSSVIYIFRKN